MINDSNDSEEDVLRRKAVSQFLDVVPKVLHKLGKPTAIVFSKLNESDNEGCATPDFGFSDYFITFTIGDTLKERIGDCALLSITSVSDGDDCVVEVCTNVVYDSICINVRLDYKTEEEWYKILNFAFDIYSQKTIHINKGFMKTENDSHEISVCCGKVADSMEKLEMLCQKEAEKLLTSLEVPVEAEVSVPFWTSDIPELICVGIFKRNENGIIVYELDFSESTL